MLRETPPPSDCGCELFDELLHDEHGPRQRGHLDARRRLAQALRWTLRREPDDRSGPIVHDGLASTARF